MLDTELYAIREALLLAQREVEGSIRATSIRAKSSRASSIRVFTDSQRALRRIQNPSLGGVAVLGEIRRLAEAIARTGKPLILH